MKIALINGSPKMDTSASQLILNDLMVCLPHEQFVAVSMKTPQIHMDEVEKLTACDTWIFAFPLYVDGVPSHVMHWLKELETMEKPKDIKVYAVVNCGFYEGTHNALALQMMKAFCHRAGLVWRQGLGIGGGGMTETLQRVVGMKKDINKAYEALCENMQSGFAAEDMFTQPNFPRMAYKIAGEMGWRSDGKANGLSPKDLFKRR